MVRTFRELVHAGAFLPIPATGQKLKARRYAKRVDKNDTATFEIWIDEASKMPVRYQIGLAENYDATILVELQGVK